MLPPSKVSIVWWQPGHPGHSSLGPMGFTALLKLSCAEVRSHYSSFHFAMTDKMLPVKGEIPSGAFSSLELLCWENSGSGE